MNWNEWVSKDSIGDTTMIDLGTKSVRAGKSDIKVIVDAEVVKILMAIEKKVPGREFTVLFKGYFDPDREAYIVLPDYVVPEQEVTPSFTQVTEDVAKYLSKGYIVAVHKHPSGLKHFSGHDYEDICATFPISLLYVDRDIPVGTVRFVVPPEHISSDDDVVMIFDVKPEIDIVTGKDDIVGVENIKTREYYREKLSRRGYTFEDYEPSLFRSARETKSFEFDEEDYEQYLRAVKEELEEESEEDDENDW